MGKYTNGVLAVAASVCVSAGTAVVVTLLVLDIREECSFSTSAAQNLDLPVSLPPQVEDQHQVAPQRAEDQFLREQENALLQQEGEAPRLREEEEQQRREAEAERQRQRQAAEAAEAAMQRQLAGEAEAAAIGQPPAQNSFLNIVIRRVERNWARPDGASDSMRATLQVRLGPAGEVLATSIVTSSGDSAFDRSAIQAVERAAPFGELRALPADQQRNLRQFNLLFTPRDVR
ncbi:MULTISPECIES: energy transducer TonB [Halomonadaceae]|uniref:energy transducer TonB n=1 Tax=Halomonadaceae TaxID=28256 RepID=UPI003CF214A3